MRLLTLRPAPHALACNDGRRIVQEVKGEVQQVDMVRKKAQMRRQASLRYAKLVSEVCAMHYALTASTLPPHRICACACLGARIEPLTAVADQLCRAASVASIVASCLPPA